MCVCVCVRDGERAGLLTGRQVNIQSAHLWNTHTYTHTPTLRDRERELMSAWKAWKTERMCLAVNSGLVDAWGRRRSARIQWHLSSPARASFQEEEQDVHRGEDISEGDELGFMESRYLCAQGFPFSPSPTFVCFFSRIRAHSGDEGRGRAGEMIHRSS